MRVDKMPTLERIEALKRSYFEFEITEDAAITGLQDIGFCHTVVRSIVDIWKAARAQSRDVRPDLRWIVLPPKSHYGE